MGLWMARLCPCNNHCIQPRLVLCFTPLGVKAACTNNGPVILPGILRKSISLLEPPLSSTLLMRGDRCLSSPETKRTYVTDKLFHFFTFLSTHRVYRSEGSWRNFSSHASNPDLKGRRNSSFSPHPNPHSHSNQNPSSYSPHSHSPHSHMGASGLPGMATPPESQHPPPHTQLRNVGYSHGTLYTPMEGEQSTSTSGGWAPRNSFSGPS